MKTRDSLCGLKNLIDNISLEKTPNVERAGDAFSAAGQECYDTLGYEIFLGFTSGFDEDNGNVLVFLPLFSLKDSKSEDINLFYETIRKKLKEANFEIVQEDDICGNVYFHVGFDSHRYILKSLL